MILALLQVIFRFVINFSLDWTEELARYAFIASIYAGASLGVTTNDHIRVEIIGMILPKLGQKIARIAADAIWLAFSVLITIQGFGISQIFLSTGQHTPTLHLPTGYVYMVVPAGFLLMSLRLVQSLCRQIRSLAGHEEAAFHPGAWTGADEGGPG